MGNPQSLASSMIDELNMRQSKNASDFTIQKWKRAAIAFRNEDAVDSYRLLGIIADYENKTDEVIYNFENAMRLSNSQNAVVLNDYRKALLNAGQSKKALSLGLSHILSNPNDVSSIQLFSAQCLFYLNRDCLIQVIDALNRDGINLQLLNLVRHKLAEIDAKIHFLKEVGIPIELVTRINELAHQVFSLRFTSDLNSISEFNYQEFGYIALRLLVADINAKELFNLNNELHDAILELDNEFPIAQIMKYVVYYSVVDKKMPDRNDAIYG